MTTEPLSKIFGSPARLKLLRLFVFNKDTSFSLDDAAQRAKVTPAAARKELNDLVAAGLVRKKGERAAARFQTNARFEQFPALAHFIRETTTVDPRRVLTGLRKAGTLHLVVLSGLFTGTIESKIDLLVAGERIEERALAQAVRSLEAELGREIRYAAFATPDFRYRLGVYDRLLRDVFDYPHRTLVDKIGL